MSYGITSGDVDTSCNVASSSQNFPLLITSFKIYNFNEHFQKELFLFIDSGGGGVYIPKSVQI